jgi:hypothetical protein
LFTLINCGSYMNPPTSLGTNNRNPSNILLGRKT